MNFSTVTKAHSIPCVLFQGKTTEGPNGKVMRKDALIELVLS